VRCLHERLIRNYRANALLGCLYPGTSETSLSLIGLSSLMGETMTDAARQLLYVCYKMCTYISKYLHMLQNVSGKIRARLV
jgi:hypothetical protein